MCKYKEKRHYRKTDSLLGNASLPRWLYRSFPLISLFTGLGFLFLVQPSSLTLTTGICLVAYSLAIFYIRIMNKNKNKK